MSQLQANFPSPNNIQNMPHPDNRKNRKSHEPHDQQRTIWVQSTHFNNRCNRAIERYIADENPELQLIIMDITKAFDAINRTQLRATLCKKGPPGNRHSYPKRTPRNKTKTKTSWKIWNRGTQ